MTERNVCKRCEKAETDRARLREASEELIVEVQAHTHPDITCLKKSLVKVEAALAACRAG